jgi:hypothetical protein
MDSEYKTLSLSDLSTPDPFDSLDLSGNQPVSSPDMNFNFATDYEASLSKGRDGQVPSLFFGGAGYPTVRACNRPADQHWGADTYLHRLQSPCDLQVRDS